MNEEEVQVAIYTPPFEPKRIRLTNGKHMTFPGRERSQLAAAPRPSWSTG
jgi:hypothetical protein